MFVAWGDDEDTIGEQLRRFDLHVVAKSHSEASGGIHGSNFAGLLVEIDGTILPRITDMTTVNAMGETVLGAATDARVWLSDLKNHCFAAA